MRSVKRFYTELKPEHYALHVTPNAQALTFTGEVTVHLKKTGRPSQRLTFHQHELKITGASITYKDKRGKERPIEVARINNQDSLDEVRLHTNEQLYSGDYIVAMQFSGVITKGMTGLYPCYFKLDNEEHVLLATQFESHHARELFPCIDEPEAKATFDLAITAPDDLTVLSNTPVKNQEPDASAPGLTKTAFETTPKMSTYLLAFVMGEIQGKTTQTKRGTEVSVWATIAQPLDTLDYALDVAKQSVEFFEDYFGVPYPLPKLDHVGLPDFTSGAMENWGLITYRERLLLAYPGQTSQSIKEYIAMVIAHETSHQWFGNLVTMRWWDDLWLNESFANMMEYQAVDALFPEWHAWDNFIMNEGLAALRRDATAGVQAVKSTVHHPDEINTLFDGSIVYAKGGRLLYMLKAYIGEEPFRKGLSQYFKKHAYGNTSGADLWQALGEASRMDVGAFMNPWLEQSGFPLVTAKQDGRKLLLTQHRFLENGAISDGRTWPVPLFYNHPQPANILIKAEQEFPLASDEPLLLNYGFAGHYIVKYANAAHQTYIVGMVKDGRLAVADRLMLLNNASMLSKAGAQPFGDVLQLLAAYTGEQSEPVWGIIALVIAEARRFIDLDETLERNIKQFIRALVAREYRRLGWNEKSGESAGDQKLRANIIGLAAYADKPEAIAASLKRFEMYKVDATSVPAELRSIVFGVAVREKVAGAVDSLLKLHDETTNSDLKADVMAALTTTRDKDEAARLLGRLTDARLVKPQDADYWLFYLIRNRHTRAVAWDWMVEHWPWIEQTYGSDKSYDDFPRVVASACNSKIWAKKYEAFFGPKRDQLILKRNIDIGLNEIATRVAWLERDLAGVKAFFETYK